MHTQLLEDGLGSDNRIPPPTSRVPAWLWHTRRQHYRGQHSIGQHPMRTQLLEDGLGGDGAQLGGRHARQDGLHLPLQLLGRHLFKGRFKKDSLMIARWLLEAAEAKEWQGGMSAGMPSTSRFSSSAGTCSREGLRERFRECLGC